MTGFLTVVVDTITAVVSGIDVGTVRKWRSAGLEEAGGTLSKHRDALVELDEELSRAKPPESWSGKASEEAGHSHGRIAQATRNLTAEVAAVRKGTLEAADSVDALIASLTETEHLAGSHGFTIADDGGIVDSDPPQDVPADKADEVKRRRAQARDEIYGRVQSILRRARDIDDDLAAVLRKAIEDSFDAEGSLSEAAEYGAARGELSITPPPNRDSPAANAAWWDSLSEQERREVIENHPEWVGNRDGIPAEVRDEANRARLDDERERLEDEIARLKAELEDGLLGGALTEADEKLAEAQRKLDAVQAIERTLSQDQPPRQLLLMDNSGEIPKAAVAIGNVDTADHVAVFTPGMKTTVGESLGGYTRDMENLWREAQQQSDAYGDGGSVATVAWLGYDAPQLTDWKPENGVYSSEAAKEGAADLADFYTGINASRDEDPHLTALGHSYGSTTTGYAVQQAGTGVDDVAFFGSPGLGTDEASEIKVPDGSIYNLEARHDPVADFGVFGGDPNRMDDGVTDLSTKETSGPAGDLKGSTGHSEYLNEDTTSQHNLGAIVSGNEDRLVEGEQTGIGDTARETVDVVTDIGETILPPW